jgi:hypothetical protein
MQIDPPNLGQSSRRFQAQALFKMPGLPLEYHSQKLALGLKLWSTYGSHLPTASFLRLKSVGLWSYLKAIFR